MAPDIAVTGATGAIGGRVARQLADRGVDQRLVVRDPSRAPELAGADVAVGTYADGDAMRQAFDGVRTVLLVSGAEARDRLDQHRTAVDSAAAAGVERIVYTSFVNAAPDSVFTLARDHFHTEAHIRHSGVALVALRDGLYTDFLPLMAGDDGVIRGPAGDGRFAPVARDDIADVAVTALLDDAHDGGAYDLTGPELLTMTDVAALVTEVTGRDVRFVDETEQEAYASRASYGAPDYEVAGWVTSYQAIAAGELAVVSDAVERVTGHPPMSVRTWLERWAAEQGAEHG